ncbi:MAG: hypothetical protein M2R45_02945 [Verrucomicrobia subdivision 3 bacterium]|nr:hypothetical protein [Limisphaerales bacterium]MCS1415335.1 hypothetical protein [Limisphaerales bacterium]
MARCLQASPTHQGILVTYAPIQPKLRLPDGLKMLNAEIVSENCFALLGRGALSS